MLWSDFSKFGQKMGKTRETGVCAKSFSLKKPKFYQSNYDVIDSGTDKDGKS